MVYAGVDLEDMEMEIEAKISDFLSTMGSST